MEVVVYEGFGICIDGVISLDSVQNLGPCLSPYNAETLSKFHTAKEDIFHVFIPAGT